MYNNNYNIIIITVSPFQIYGFLKSSSLLVLLCGLRFLLFSHLIRLFLNLCLSI